MTITRLSIARVLYMAATLPLVGFAVIYLTRGQFMPYHALAVGQSWETLAPGIQILVLALMRVVGGAWLAAAAAIIFLVAFPLRRGERWAIFATPIVGLLFGVSALLTTLWVSEVTPADPPWLAAAIGNLFFLAGFALTLRCCSKDQQQQVSDKEPAEFLTCH